MAKVSKKAYWNIATTKALLLVNDRAVEDALIVVYNNQTPHEQVAESTTVENGKGFTGTNAEFGTSLAKQILARREAGSEYNALSQKQITYARKIALLHWGQFAEALNDERKEQGLETKAPNLDRFTWKPGDLHKLSEEQPTKADPEREYSDPLFDETEEPVTQAPAPKQHVEYAHELFEEDEEPLRNLVDMLKACQLDHEAFDRDVATSREWKLYLEVISQETDAWLRLVYAASTQPYPVKEWGTVPQLSSKFRAAQERAEVVQAQLGLVGEHKRSHGAAGTWQKSWGTDSKATDRWLASSNGKLWVAGHVPATVVTECAGVVK